MGRCDDCHEKYCDFPIDSVPCFRKRLHILFPCAQIFFQNRCLWWTKSHCISWTSVRLAPYPGLITPLLRSRYILHCCTLPHLCWRTNTLHFLNPENQKVISSRLNEWMNFFSFNAPFTQNSFTLGNAHKAYLRGILFQMSSKLKKDRNKNLSNSWKINKKSLPLLPFIKIYWMPGLTSVWTNAHYNPMNKPSKLMGRRLQRWGIKQKFQFSSLSRHHKISNPQAMMEGTVPSEMLQPTIITLPKPGKSTVTPF